MNIYLSHSSGFDFRKELYEPLMESPLWTQHKIILPHAASHDPVNTKSLIQSCDLLVAETSYPSTGSGIEIGWACAASVRIAALHKIDRKPSSSVKIVTNEIFSYQDFLKSFEQLLA